MSNSIKTRDSALKAIKRYMTKSVDEGFTMDTENIISYQQLLNEQWSRFNIAQDEVEGSCGIDSAELEENKRIDAETCYSTASANFSRVQKSRIESHNNVAKALVSAPVRLPKMELPSFFGDSTEWIGFHDVYSSLVDNNSELSNVQKLHYLRSCLRGDALKIISGFKICDANYVEAWGLLKSRYKVMRVIVEAHLRALRDVKNATNDSADAIKGVIDESQQHIRELKALGRPVQFWGDWLVHNVVDKLAFETRKQWELSLISDEPPTFEQLTEFLEIRCRSLSMLPSLSASDAVSANKSTNVYHAIREQDDVCVYCNGSHKIYSCEKFRVLGLTAKSSFVIQARLCLNCLSAGNFRERCNSISSCRVCEQRHHTLLHGVVPTNNSLTASSYASNAYNPFSAADSLVTENTSSAYDPLSSADVSHVSACLNSNANLPPPVEKVVLLSTALVKVRDCSGSLQPARLLFDTGSHASFVTEACVQRLGVPRTASEVHITGIGSAQGGPAIGEVSLSLSSHRSNQCFIIKALILPKITSDLPMQTVAVSPWPHTQGLCLADPQFMQPGQIDILIGMDVMDKLICAEFRKGPPGTPMTQLTVFGWTLFGSLNVSRPTKPRLQSLYCDVHLDYARTKLGELKASSGRAELRFGERFCKHLPDLPLENSQTQAPLNRLCLEKSNARNIIDQNHTESANKVFFLNANTLFPLLEIPKQTNNKSNMVIRNIRLIKECWDEIIPETIAVKWLQNLTLSLLFATLKVNRWGATEVKQRQLLGGGFMSAYASKLATFPHVMLCVAHFAVKQVQNVLCNRPRHLPFAWDGSIFIVACVLRFVAYFLHILFNVKGNKQLNGPKSFGTPTYQELSKAAFYFIRNKKPVYLSNGIAHYDAKRPIPLCTNILLLQSHHNALPVKRSLRNNQFALGICHPNIIRNSSNAMINVCEIYKLTFYAKPCIMQIVLQRHCWVIELRRYTNRTYFLKTLVPGNSNNFIGANKEIIIAFQRCISDYVFPSFLADCNIEWFINPPAAPLMETCWKICIIRVKNHLNRTLSDTLLPLERFNTLLPEVKTCANYRLPCEISSDAVSLEVLNPRTLLAREPFKLLPEPEGQGFCGNRQRWQTSSAPEQHFRRLWGDECLRHCTKCVRLSNIEERDEFSAFNVSNPPTMWSLTRLVKYPPRNIWRVRAVFLKAPYGQFTYPTLHFTFFQGKETYLAKRDGICYLLILLRFKKGANFNVIFCNSCFEHTKVVQGRRYVEFIPAFSRVFLLICISVKVVY